MPHTKSAKKKRQLNLRKSILPIISTSILFLSISIFYSQSLKSHPFHIDEQEFIRKTYYFDLFFIKRDLSDPRWYTQDAPAQPKFGPYIFGLSLKLGGVNNITKTLNETEFGKIQPNPPQWWEELWGKPLQNPPEELLPKLKLVWIGRQTAFFFTLAAFAAFYLVAYQTNGFLFALIATGLLSLNHLMNQFGKRAMTDSMQLLFLYISVLLSFAYTKALDKKRWRNLFLLSILIGANAAFAVGVKVSGILTLFLLSLILSFSIYTKIAAQKTLKPTIASIIVIVLSFSVVLIPFHPYLYKNPTTQFIAMYTERLESAYQHRLRLPLSAVYTRRQAADLVLKRTLLPAGDFTNFPTDPIPVDLVLFILGIYLMLKRRKKEPENQRVLSKTLILLLWTGLVIGSLILYLNNNWPRYYLPVVSVITLTQAYALAAAHQLWFPFANRLRKSKLSS